MKRNSQMQFDTQKEIILENETILMRPLQEGDLQHLLPFAEQEPEIWVYSLFSAAGEQQLKRYLQTAQQSRKAGFEYPFIVWDKRTQRYAGTTRFYDIQNQHDTVQIGYTWYGKEFQGTGLNKICKYLLLEFAFEQLQVARVEFRADKRNLRSIAAMKSIGCVEEGVLRSNCATTQGERRDSIILSILPEEWHNGVKNRLQQKINGI